RVGAGDNGGDALFAGAELAAEGVDVVAVPTSDAMHPDGAETARAAGVRFAEPGVAGREATHADVIVDGILGTGATGALRGTARTVVAAILPLLDAVRRPIVVAVDLPSGIGPDDGAVPDPTVLPADLTVTFGAEKAGLLLEPGSRDAGLVVLVDLELEPYLEGVPLVVTEGAE